MMVSRRKAWALGPRAGIPCVLPPCLSADYKTDSQPWSRIRVQALRSDVSCFAAGSWVILKHKEFLVMRRINGPVLAFAAFGLLAFALAATPARADHRSYGPRYSSSWGSNSHWNSRSYDCRPRSNWSSSRHWSNSRDCGRSWRRDCDSDRRRFDRYSDRCDRRRW